MNDIVWEVRTKCQYVRATFS